MSKAIVTPEGKSTREEISMALLTLEEQGLIEVDEEENTFEPTDAGLEQINGEAKWLIELKKLHRKAHPNNGRVIMEKN